MSPEILVRHIFNFTFWKSLKNAFRKSSYWTFYSLKNRDLFKDSGTASAELKINVASGFFIALLILLSVFVKDILFLMPVPFIFGANLWINRKFLDELYKTKGLSFALSAMFFYTMIYPVPIVSGALTGALMGKIAYSAPSNKI